MFRILLRICIALFALAVLALYSLPPILIRLEAKYIFSNLGDVPNAPVAIVLGAGVNPDGTLSAALKARVDAGLALYKHHKVQKLLMSGDNSRADYDEPSAMKKYALAHGALPQDVIRDYAGLHTYDTCYRARSVFGVTDAIFVSQAFHLPRAVFIARHLGITAYGYTSDNAMDSRSVAFFQNRERPLAIEAILLILIHHQPKYAGPAEPQLIPSTDPNR